jgi:uncharacterized protein
MDNLLEDKKDEILLIATRHGAKNVRIFGSRLHGNYDPDSDLDLLVDINPEHSPWFPAGLIIELEELLGCKVDVVTRESLHWYIRDSVLNEAQPL